MGICPFLTPTAPFIEGADHDEEMRHLLRCREEDCLVWSIEYHACNIPRLAELVSGVQLIEARSESKIERMVHILTGYSSDISTQLTGFEKATEQATIKIGQNLKQVVASGFDDLQDLLRTQLNFIQNGMDENSDKIKSSLDNLKDALLQGIDRIIQSNKSQAERLSHLLEGQNRLFTDFISVQNKRMEKMEDLVELTARNNQQILNFLNEQETRRQAEDRRRQIQEGRDHNNQGVALFHKQAYEAAAAEFKEAITLFPDFPEAHNNLGLTLSRLKQSDEAKSHFIKAIKLLPDMVESYINLGCVYHLESDFNEAIKYFEEALKHKGNLAPAYTNLGNAYHELDKFKEAVSAWKRAVEIDPDEIEAKTCLERYGASNQEESESQGVT
ncbi:MAG: hypothetical protein B6244_05390 [Candidatus Cloacimonetes bacterium 4572_55]|nr:MAG: hypothetical protein B6244_05390 [Candidatus Cloacimonetes bacterium 4572_55]